MLESTKEPIKGSEKEPIHTADLSTTKVFEDAYLTSINEHVVLRMTCRSIN
jgi:hypothetical protein